MPLMLGKTFDRSYMLRLPIVDGFYNIGVFFNKRSSFVLFRVDPDFSNQYSNQSIPKHGIKINMFKNLESSKFCETFLNLHNYRKTSLDIRNQFDSVKSEYHTEVNFIFNETINVAKVDIGDRELFDALTLYGFCLTSYMNEFTFIICERHNIVKRLNKKVVRTTGLQIATAPALSLLDEFHEESRTAGKVGLELKHPTNGIINLSEK